MGSKPSCRRRIELVHSHAPPKSACPASLLPLAVTATGYQFWKPTLAPVKSMKVSFRSLPADAPPLVASQGSCGGVSSTPLLLRCLLPTLVSAHLGIGQDKCSSRCSG